MTVALALSSCGGSSTASSFGHISVPNLGHTCPATSSNGSLQTVSVKVIRPTSRAVVIVAGVCIDHRGPFPFAVDTGASSSAVDESLATQLHLMRLTDDQSFDSFGCRRQVYVASVTGWALGRAQLPSDDVLVGPLRSPRFPGLDGLLGADVMSRFGSVRIDFERGTLTFGILRPPLSSDVVPKDPIGIGPDSLSPSGPSAVPMTVLVSRFAVAGLGVRGPLLSVVVDVTVSVGPTSYQFALDTGASQTVVSPVLAFDSRLRRIGKPGTTYAGLSCPVEVQFYELPSWTVGAVPLAGQLVGSNALPPATDGLLGSGTLAMHNPVVVDFADGELLLGS